jgi:hypothetical protein
MTMDANPWFIIYKGRAQYKLSPASRDGWMSFAVFMLVALLPVLAMPLLPNPVWGMAIWFVTFPLAFFVFWRFAKTRARIIDLTAVERDWDEFEAWRKRGKR